MKMKFAFTKSRFIASLVLSIIFVTVVGLIFTYHLVEMITGDVQSDVNDANTIISLNLTNELKRIENAAVAIAGSPLTLPLFEANTAENIGKANNILDRYHKSLDAAACYLIAENGLTLTSSNRNAADSFVGQNYTFRPYFQQAIKGGTGRYFALGTVSGKRGFFASASVKNKEGRVVGVVAIKKELDEIETNLKQYIWFLTDQNGIIFLSSQPEARLKSLWPLDKKLEEQIVASKQYGPGPFKSILQKKITPGEEVTFREEQFLASLKTTALEGISVVLFWPTGQISMYRTFGIVLTLLINLLILSFLTTIYIFKQSNLKTRKLLAESQSQALALAESEKQLRSRKDELEQSREILTQTEERSRLILTSVSEGIWGLDKDGKTTFVNRAAVRMLGYTEEELISQPMHTLVHYAYPDGSAYPREKCPMYRTFLDGRTFNVSDDVLWRKDGSSFPVEYSTTPIYKNDELIGTVVTFHDITERKKTDALKVEKEVAEEAAARAEKAKQEAIQAQEELKSKMLEIERFNRLSQGREKRIIELKKQVNDLAVKAGGNNFYQEQEITKEADEGLLRTESEEGDSAQSDFSSQVIAEMLGVDKFQRLLEDFCDSVGIASAIIDLNGKVLAAARWQRACTDFHRANEKTCARCIESDTELALKLNEGKSFSVYRCKNGLTDAASPIIVNGKHIANTFVGQFFTAPPDMDFFRRQADDCGLDKEGYLEAISRVPIVMENKLESILGFLVGVSQTVATMSMERELARKAQISIARRIEESRQERLAAMSLAEDANNAHAELEQYKDSLELLVKERTEKLLTSEERSRLILTSVQEGIWGLDKDGKTTFVNRAVIEMLGYEEKELIGSNMHALVHYARPDGSKYPQEDCPMYKTSLDGKPCTVSDEVLWRKNGSSFSVEYSTTPIYKDTELIGSVVTFRDITKRKAMEEAVRKAQERLQNIMDSSPIAVAVSAGGAFRFANPTFLKMFGIRLGDSAVKIYQNPEDRLPILERLQKEGVVSNHEIKMRGAEGRIIDIMVTFLPTTYEGEPGVLGWLVDLTERKKAEEELRARMEELERFTKLTIDREERMIELKKEINALMIQSGKEEKYKIVD